MRFSVVPAAYVYLRRGDEVLLQLRQGTGYMDGHWTAGAAGHVDAGETAAVAARREAVEELGVRIEVDALRPSCVMQRTDGSDDPGEQRVDWFFTAERWSGTPTILEPQKCADLRWFDLSKLPSAVPSYEQRALAWLREHDEVGVLSDGYSIME